MRSGPTTATDRWPGSSAATTRREFRHSPNRTVFDPDGRALGFVETPGGFGVFEIGEDYILGSTTDELGVEYVQLRELGRSKS